MINCDPEVLDGLSLYEATCAKVNMIDLNKSQEEQKLSESMKLCKITPTNDMTREGSDFKEECNSDSTDSSGSTLTELNKNEIDKEESDVQAEDPDAIFSTEFVEFTSEKNGAKIVFATDDFYGIAENLLKDDDPVCNEHTIFSNKDKVDGWKTAKLRRQQENFVIIQLAVEANIKLICIDTACLIDLYSSEFSVQGGILSQCVANKYLKTRNRGKSNNVKELLFIENETKDWPYLVPMTKLNPGYPSIRKKVFGIAMDTYRAMSHLRLNIYPDGSIARLRAYGTPMVNANLLLTKREINLLSPLYNSHCMLFTDAYIGHPNNIIQLNDATSIIDGWLTTRKFRLKNIFNQNVSFEQMINSYWATFKLAFIGTVTRVIIDTRLFAGNAPYVVRVQGAFLEDDINANIIWKNIIPQAYIKPGKEQKIIAVEKHVVNTVKLIIKPDGGISRFRVIGIPGFEELK